MPDWHPDHHPDISSAFTELLNLVGEAMAGKARKPPQRHVRRANRIKQRTGPEPFAKKGNPYERGPRKNNKRYTVI